MSRIRTVKPEWLEDELLASASDEARVLSIALLLMADDHGRGRASLAEIATAAWRYEMAREDGAKARETLAKASRALQELHEMRFVTLYEVSGQRYFEIRNWSKHQKVDRPSKPRVPAPLDDPREPPPTPSRDTRDCLATDPIPPTRTEERSARAREPVPLSVAEQAWWSVIGGRGGTPVHAHDDAKHWRTIAEAADALVPPGEIPRAWLEAHLGRWLSSRTSRRGPKPEWWADALREEAAAGALGHRDIKPAKPPDAPLRYVRPDGSLTDDRREAERDRVSEEPRENPDWWAWKERQAS